MKESKYIEEAWKSYLAQIVPKTAGAGQISDTRKAFYAGASVLFYQVLHINEGADEKRAFENMAAIDDEIVRFVAETCGCSVARRSRPDMH